MRGLCVRLVFEDVLDAAVQYAAKRVERSGGDGLAVLHAVKRVCRYAELVNQRILGHVTLVQRLVKWLV